MVGRGKKNNSLYLVPGKDKKGREMVINSPLFFRDGVRERKR